jgi:branched-chain amino acid transport system substrate-binding protein
VAVAIAGLVAVSCGTRLPDAAFDTAAGHGVDGPAPPGARETSGERGAGDEAIDGTSAVGTDLGNGPPSGGDGARAAAAPDVGTGGDASLGERGADGGVSGGGGGGVAAAGSGGAGNVNAASDVGITPNEIRVGNITAIGGPLGPEIFSGMLHGAQTYFQALNERGGINGRKVRFSTCDDRESSDRNNACAQSLVEQQKVFALVANSTVAYAAARFVDSKGVPDIGGQPIGNAYYKYPHLHSILGVDTPRTGKDVGEGGKLFARTGTYRYFKQQMKINRAAVFFYFIPISRTYGLFVADGLEREGIDVVYFGGGSEAGMNPAAPTYDTDVIQMRNRGVEGIWNGIDIAGLQKLCHAMDRYGFRVKANVSTIQAMSQKVGEDFSAPCRNDVWSITYSKGYQESNDAPVAQFRAAMEKYDPRFRLHQWALEGWAAGTIFTDGVERMGASPTRKGLLDWLNSIPHGTYDVGGLFFRPVAWQPLDHSKPYEDCFSLHQWQDAAGTFVLRARQCPVTPWYFYTPQDDGA